MFTIGHSTRDLADFSSVLQAHEIRVLEDIRAFPMSRRHPHFNREHLELWLPEIGCEYIWEKDLGGRRGKQMPPDESPNIALRNPSFRNYADYMLSEKFARRLHGWWNAQRNPIPPSCARSNFISAAIACWFLITWWPTGTPCCTSWMKSRPRRMR